MFTKNKQSKKKKHEEDKKTVREMVGLPQSRREKAMPSNVPNTTALLMNPAQPISFVPFVETAATRKSRG